jgi:hypothetical protein
VADSSVLGAKCPDALLRLFDYSLRERDGGCTADQADEDAATAVFVSQQHELRRRGVGLRLEGDAFYELSTAVQWTRRVLIDRRKKKGAKLLELELTDGEPLAICVGAGYEKVDKQLGLVRRGSIKFGGGQLPVLGYGCIFLDRADAVGGRSFWLRWCPEHKPKKHQAARSLRAARTPPRVAS